MNIRTLLKKTLLGTSLPNEYVCFSAGALSDPLSVFLETTDGRFDVSNENILLGYKPVLIGLPGTVHQEAGTLSFEWTTGKKTERVAQLTLKKSHECSAGGTPLHVWEATRGRHKLIPGVQQFLSTWYERLRSKKTGNVGLPGNLYDQVRIAYAVARPISIISLGDRGQFNFFPTDLHGAVGARGYAGSLRIGGKACGQVESLNKVIISTVRPDSFRETYALGKNHMSSLRDLSFFDARSDRSVTLHLPVPSSATGYRELIRTGSFDAGIHRIHLYDVVNQVQLAPDRLAHVHNYFAQWRTDNFLSTPWLIR